jgi:tricorn protease
MRISGLALLALTLAASLHASTVPTSTNTTLVSGLNARLFRYPHVSANQIVFVYAGDIWVMPKSGGYAQRLSSPKGEELFPRFSPDGNQIAFSANYDGNMDIYVMPSIGGLPQRITYHGASDRLLGWYPDGRHLLFASTRTSEKERFNKLFKVSVDGGLPEQLPIPYGEFGAISPDSKTLAYTPISVDFSTWKRYRGGMNPDIWLFDLQSFKAKNISHDEAADTQPMWHGSVLYFLSDRDKNKRANIWAYDTKKDKFRQVTFFEEFDIHFPAIGEEEIVFENGGRLFLLDLQTEKPREVDVKVLTDRSTLKPRLEDVSKYIHKSTVSPGGKRVALEARGDLFTVPAEHGITRNLTRSSGVAERFPAWSPDGKWIAYFTDRTGEYELAIRPADGTGKEEILTNLGPGFRYNPNWSPDSKKIVFIDQAMRIQLHDLDRKETRQIDKQLNLYHSGLDGFDYSWSSDSRWLTYAADQTNQNSAIVIYDTKDNVRHQVTSGFYEDDHAVFDPDGKYLYYRSGRNFEPVYSDLDNSWIYPNTRKLLAVTLRKDLPSPLAPRNDDEPQKSKDKEKASKEKEKADEPEKKKQPPQLDEKKENAAEKPDKAKEETKEDKSEKKDDKSAEKSDAKTDTRPAKRVDIDFADFERRAVILPPKPGYYADMAAVSGKLIYRRLARAGSADDKTPLMFYDFEKREEKTIADDVDDATLSANRDKLLVRKTGSYSIIDVKEGQKLDKKIKTSGLETIIDPAAEWKQLFTDAWRIQRDYFYDPGMHGVDWKAMRSRYGAMLEDAVTRWDVNYLLGELIGELNSSHTYRSGGDTETPEQKGVGYLGVDFALENGAYRIKRILEAAQWDNETRSPLKEPGVDVKEGDYLLAVNGLPLDASQEPYAAFQGLADKPVFIAVSDKPNMEGSREVLVQTLSSESRLRNLAWINANRRRVAEMSEGKIGYVYVPDTGRQGQNELVRQFRGQIDKAALIIDERFNSGGQIPDRFVEMLGRTTLNYWGVRDGRDWSWPQTAHNGPKAMLINGWSGSGGDCFPYYFQKAGLGPLIGTRTWGGLIGITGAPSLVDNGSISVPTFGIYNTKGEWIIEGHGVDPDIPVVDDPSFMVKGGDPQIDRAVQELTKALKKNPPATPKKPKYPLRAGR